MKKLATFESTLFSPFLPEDKQVNDGVYGAELAWWLCKNLATKSIFTSYPEFEDFTWFLSYQHSEQELELHCHNLFKKDNIWEIEVKTYRSGIFKFKKVPDNIFAELNEAIKEILQESADIKNLVLHSTC